MKEPDFSRLDEASEAVLGRELTDGYQVEWTERIAVELSEVEAGGIAALVFFVHGYWFALETRFIKSVFELGPVNRLPFRSNKTLRGLVNIQGNLYILFSLKEMLDLSRKDKGYIEDAPADLPRGILIEHNDFCSGLSVNYVRGVRRFHKEELERVSGGDVFGMSPWLQGFFALGSSRVGLLKPEALFEGIRGACE